MDEWGVSYKTNTEAVAHPLRGPIRTLADARAYQPPDPHAPHRLGKLPDLVARYKGRRTICFHHRAAFMWSAYLMGIDAILMNFLAEPELVELVLDKVLAGNLEVVRDRQSAQARSDRPRRRLRQQQGAHDEPRRVRPLPPPAAQADGQPDP